MITGKTAEIDLRADDVPGGRHALSAVFDLIEERRRALDDQAGKQGVPAAGVRYTGPAFVVGVGGVDEAAPVIADDECRAYLEHVARHGARCGVVVELHGTAAAVSAACAGSRGLLAALLDRRAVRVVEPTSGVERPAVVTGRPEPGEPGHLAALVMGADAAGAGQFLGSLIEAGGASAAAMAFLGAELRRAADALDPEGGFVTCPLCLPAGRHRPDEIEAHLVRSHSALSQGARA